jgi:hypothetical protein
VLELRPMKFLNISRRLVFVVLFLYGLTLASAIAAPVVFGNDMKLMCTSTGFKFINIKDPSSPTNESSNHGANCPLCLNPGLEPTWPVLTIAPFIHSLSYQVRSIPAARLASIVSAPLPARGPPAFSS